MWPTVPAPAIRDATPATQLANPDGWYCVASSLDDAVLQLNTWTKLRGYQVKAIPSEAPDAIGDQSLDITCNTPGHDNPSCKWSMKMQRVVMGGVITWRLFHGLYAPRISHNHLPRDFSLGATEHNAKLGGLTTGPTDPEHGIGDSSISMRTAFMAKTIFAEAQSLMADPAWANRSPSNGCHCEKCSTGFLCTNALAELISANAVPRVSQSVARIAFFQAALQLEFSSSLTRLSESTNVTSPTGAMSEKLGSHTDVTSPQNSQEVTILAVSPARPAKRKMQAIKQEVTATPVRLPVAAPITPCATPISLLRKCSGCSGDFPLGSFVNSRCLECSRARRRRKLKQP